MQVSESGNCSKQALEAARGSSLAGVGSERAPQCWKLPVAPLWRELAL